MALFEKECTEKVDPYCRKIDQTGRWESNDASDDMFPLNSRSSRSEIQRRTRLWL